MSLDKPAKELIVDMINATRIRTYPQAIPYGYEDVTLEDPELTPYDHEKNTDLVVKSASGETPLAVPRHIYYNRIPLTDRVYQVLGPNAVPQIEDEGYMTVADLLPTINALLSIQLTEAEIEDEPLPEGSYPKNVVVRVKSTCLVYTGQISLQMIDNVQS